jgi:hypothetical protein
MGRGGFRWAKLSQLVYATYGPVCNICFHGIPGGLRTGQVDHLIPFCDQPELQFELTNLRPVHGHPHRCPVCGHKCNQVRGARSLEYARRKVSTPVPGFPGSPLEEKHRESGREWLTARGSYSISEVPQRAQLLLI